MKRKLKTFGFLSFLFVSESYASSGIVELNERLVDAAYSFAPVIAIAAFLVGAASLFTAVTVIRNHSENPKEYPLKNAVFYGIAAAVGLGYSYNSSTLMETFYGKGGVSEDIESDIFDTRSNNDSLDFY